MDSKLKRWKLIKDLPFQKADDTEWEISEEYNTEFRIKDINGIKSFKWVSFWGNPFTSGWFEEVKPKRWRAENGNYYYSILSSGLTSIVKEVFEIGDLQRHVIGNYFRTEEQAQEAANRIKKLLAEYREEINKE